ncbi:hypothetical protein ACF08W_28740 [Streptomyces sp. NPDC015144]|uniref:hypothetical protein n=1 Tax=Streptomyces sp. NPDC015144 TaxID=3364944 RepID=UPI0036FBA5DC
MTFEFTIPPGTPTNVRTNRRTAAVDAMKTTVTAIAARELPPETSMTMRHEWAYAWQDTTTEPVTLGPEAP